MIPTTPISRGNLISVLHRRAFSAHCTAFRGRFTAFLYRVSHQDQARKSSLYCCMVNRSHQEPERPAEDEDSGNSLSAVSRVLVDGFLGLWETVLKRRSRWSCVMGNCKCAMLPFMKPLFFDSFCDSTTSLAGHLAAMQMASFPLCFSVLSSFSSRNA